MSLSQQTKRNVAAISALLLALLFGFVNCGYAWDYGNGRHGSYVLTTNTTIEQLFQTVRLTNDPVQYNPSDSNAIPNFQNLIITNGATLTASNWNGSTGGTIILKVQATLSVAAGAAISVDGIGYRGGASGQQGESYAGGQGTSTSANYGGGGGGLVQGGGGLVFVEPAGGGGYGSAGANGQWYYYGTYNGGLGGSPYGTDSLGTLYLGSGGGGGVNYYTCGISGSTTGGNGGGSIQLQVGNLQIQGVVTANGGGGGTGCGGGGGGSGGSILFRVAAANLGTNTVSAAGGSGGYSAGGNGGSGRIRLEYAENFVGTTTPTASILLDTNSDNVTIITNQPASQISFLASNVVFSVGVTGFSPLFFQWNFNNVPIPNATNQILSLVNLAFTNQGNYSVAISNVVGTVVSSNAFLTVLDPRNPFGDGIPNYWKTQYGLSLIDPTLATNYPAGDKLTYLEKYLYGLNPLTNDTDGDGLTDYDEIFIYHTNPLLADTDGDGIPDGWEVQHGLNPLVNDATQIGSDGVSNLQIYQYDLTNSTQLNPRNPFFAPGTSIYEVLNNGQHTNRYYYDHEDRLVGVETSRGISIAYTYDGNSNLKRQTVLSRAGETNGLPVLWQFLNGLTNGTTASGPYGDPDGDGWSNYQEWLAGTDPNNLQSIPSLLNNPGTNIASIAFPFTPSNCVVAAGQLNGVAGDEIVVGADGNATGKTNSLFILTQGASSWQVLQLPVGAFGITSIAVGQPTNRPSPAIYIGLRQTAGTGAIWELFQTNGLWQTNVLAVSTNQAAYVLGVRSTDVLCSFATNGQDGALYSLAYSGGTWNQTVVSTNSSHRGLGTHALVPSRIKRDASLRLIDGGGIQIIGGSLELFVGGYLIPSNSVYYSATGKWYYQTPSAMSWPTAEAFCQNVGGNLVTIQNISENTFIAQNLPNWPAWIGFYVDAWPSQFTPGPTGWASGANDSFTDYVNCGRNPIWYYFPSYANYAAFFDTNGSCGGNGWYSDVQSASYFGIGEAIGTGAYFTNQWLIPEPPATNRFPQLGLTLATGLPRPSQTNSISIFYAFADDQNFSGQLDAGDVFTLAEYIVSGNTWTTNTLFQVLITSANVAQSFSLAAVNFTGTGKDTLFTGEPDGRIYSWSGVDASSPLQRQLFSDAYVGKAWQAMCGVQMPAFGKGLAGLMVDPTNQNVCNVIFWPPQAVLPTPQPSLIETAPYAAVIPSVNPLGSNAVVTIRLWDNEGNASTPFLQYQILGASTWQTATLTALDGAAYNPSARVTALPTGNNHTLGWNALADFGANIATNILLRASAQDFMLTGSWSSPTPFQLNTTVATVSTPTNPPVNFTGFTRVQGGIGLNWQSGSNAFLYLQRSPALAGTNAVWVNIWTSAPPTLMSGSFTDFFGTNLMEFYRMKIVSP
jgi:YD repeat-containing protein